MVRSQEIPDLLLAKEDTGKSPVIQFQGRDHPDAVFQADKWMADNIYLFDLKILQFVPQVAQHTAGHHAARSERGFIKGNGSGLLYVCHGNLLESYLFM